MTLGQRDNVVVTESEKNISGFSYYEYKYLVPHSYLSGILDILNEFCGHTDPYPSGVVDSIYYDTPDEKLLDECMNGNAEKCKFRIRGYGGSYLQIHQKIKDLSSVNKLKTKIRHIRMAEYGFPHWDELESLKSNDPVFQQILYHSRQYGLLVPSIRVKYFRYRFRVYDYRITLDTNVEVFSPINGLPRLMSYKIFPNHVLEIKTREERPKLPFIGLIKLPQVSFSKFLLGVQALNDYGEF